MTLEAVVFENVSFAYPGGPTVLESVSLRAGEGELVAVIGPNGGGKSTLLKILVGLLRGWTGRVSIFGRTPEQARREGLVGYVPQYSMAERAFPVSARQAAAMPALLGVPAWRPTPGKVRERVDECLARVGATDYAEKPVGRLSGGQWQRVMIARALAQRPRVLALDEPLVGVDPVGQAQFASLLHVLRREMGLTIILVTHDIRTAAGAAAECDRVACLRRTLHLHDTPKGVTPQVLAEVFQHDLADAFGDVHIDAHRAAECAGGHVIGGGVNLPRGLE